MAAPLLDPIVTPSTCFHNGWQVWLFCDACRYGRRADLEHPAWRRRWDAEIAAIWPAVRFVCRRRHCGGEASLLTVSWYPGGMGQVHELLRLEKRPRRSGASP